MSNPEPTNILHFPTGVGKDSITAVEFDDGTSVVMVDDPAARAARERREDGDFTHDEIVALVTRLHERDGESAANIVHAVEKPWKWWNEKLDLYDADGCQLWETYDDLGYSLEEDA